MMKNHFDNDFAFDWIIKKAGGQIPQENNGIIERRNDFNSKPQVVEERKENRMAMGQ